MPDRTPGNPLTLHDLPSPYQPHAATGLLHLPRFLAKIRKHLCGELPESYRRNFTKGFDGFLCAHLGIEPAAVIEAVRLSADEAELERRLRDLLSADPKAHLWNRKVVQMGMSEMGRESLEQSKAIVGCAGREDIRSFADVIEFDEGRLR